MHAIDSEVLGRLTAWLDAGQPCWLATVIRTWGSSPRPVGSVFACNANGQMVGSLSGGCVEDDLLEKLTNGELAAEQAQFFGYGVTPEETERLGLPCGGHLDIIIEPIPATNEALEHFRHLSRRLSKRQCIERHVDLRSHEFTHKDVDSHKPLLWDEHNERLAHTYGPRHQLFIIGAGAVSKYLAEMALVLDYQVTVCDPREHLINDFDVQDVTLVCDMPDDAVVKYAQDAATAIVALTHDPRIDDMGLMQALKAPAFYIGAMGSTRTSASRRARLLELDLSPAEIERLHAPIGLPIGSKTPPEIAIAILAEITAVRKHVRTQSITQLRSIDEAFSAG